MARSAESPVYGSKTGDASSPSEHRHPALRPPRGFTCRGDRRTVPLMTERPLVLKTHFLAGLLSVVVALVLPASARTQMTAYTGASVWDGTGAPVSTASLLVEDGVIRGIGPALAIPPGATVVPLDGLFLMPGLVNTHGHVSGRWATNGASTEEDRIREDLLLYARYGVTTVNSLGDGTAALRIAGEPHDGSAHARLSASGAVVASPDPLGARAQAAANAEGGASWLKVRVDDNLGASDPMPWDAVEAVFEVGQETGVPVATHLFYLEDARRLLEMGTGMVAHSVRDAQVDEGFAEALAASGSCYVPTLTREVSTFIYGSRPDFFDDPFFRRLARPEEVARLDDPELQERFRRDPTAERYRRALDQAMENLVSRPSSGSARGCGSGSAPTPGRPAASPDTSSTSSSR